MEKMVVSANEAAELLNQSNEQTIEALNNGEIPAYKIGRNWKIPVDGLRTYVNKKAQHEMQKRKKAREGCTE